jgi:hypothetical protein
VFLLFNPYRMFQHPDAPLFFDIRPFAQHLILKKIFGDAFNI